MSTIIIKADADQEHVIRATQLGIRFPDGSVVWANAGIEHTPENQFIRWQDSTFYIHPSRDHHTGASSWAYLQTRWANWCQDNHVPEADLIRTYRKIIVVIDEAQDVDA